MPERQMFNDLREHRADLEDSIGGLQEALATPVGEIDSWQGKVHAALLEFKQEVEVHAEVTEAPDGLYEDLRSKAPRLSNHVDGLIREHGKFRDDVNKLLAQQEAGLDSTETISYIQSVNELVESIRKHRQRAIDLIYQAYGVDIGGDE